MKKLIEGDYDEIQVEDKDLNTKLVYADAEYREEAYKKAKELGYNSIGEALGKIIRLEKVRQAKQPSRAKEFTRVGEINNRNKVVVTMTMKQLSSHQFALGLKAISAGRPQVYKNGGVGDTKQYRHFKQKIETIIERDLSPMAIQEIMDDIAEGNGYKVHIV